MVCRRYSEDTYYISIILIVISIHYIDSVLGSGNLYTNMDNYSVDPLNYIILTVVRKELQKILLNNKFHLNILDYNL